VRDFVLGVRFIDGKGEPLTFGGQVMKNVVGYDVSHLLAGTQCQAYSFDVSQRLFA
jgi:glycolate oxidase FAD binding subunit